MQKISRADHFRSASRGLLFILIFFLPLLALPFTPEPLELNKQTLLLLLSFTAVIAWFASQLIEKQARFRRGWMNVAPLLLLAAFVLPAISSASPYLSWVGANRQEYTSVLTILGCAILIWILATSIVSRRSHQILHAIFVFSTSITALLAVLSFFGVPVFSVLNLAVAFNTVGSFTNFVVFLIVMNAFFISAFISHKQHDSLLNDGWLGAIERGLIIALALTTFFFLLVLDYWPLWLLFSVSLSIPFVFVFFRAEDFPSQKRLLVPLVMLLAALPFWFFIDGVSFQQTPLEVAPNFDSSLNITQQALQKFSSHFGSGPGTFAIDYTMFRGNEINQTDFWDTRFDRADSNALTMLSTLGVFGATLFALFILLFFFRSALQIVRPLNRCEWLESFVHLTPWCVLVFSSFFFPWDMTLMGSFAIFSGLLVSQTMSKETQLSFKRSPSIALVCSFVFAFVSFIFLVGIFVTTQRYMAEVSFARAMKVNQEGGDTQKIVELLDRSARLNRYHDTYYRALGDALLLRVEEELAGVDSMDTLTPDSSRYIQELVASVVNAHARATELSPFNAVNWLARGNACRELIPVMGQAAEFAVQSHERAVELDPMNPRVATELGRTLFAAAQAVRPLTSSSDQSSASTAQKQLEKYLGDAEQIFGRAIQLKANYAPAHFELALVYEAQGRMDEAVKKMEAVALYNPLDVGAQFQLGVLYLRRGNVGDVSLAKKMLERAVELSPKYSNARWFLASIYEGQGDIASAAREVEEVLALNPGNKLVEARLERLLSGQIATELPEAIE
jgi:tetratricopeptide (TPR) repeat protein